MKISTIWAIVFILGSSIAVAQDHAPAPLLPDRIPFVSPPLSGMQVAQLLGDPKQPTPYLDTGQTCRRRSDSVSHPP
ncbi:MAG: hypothetical protein R3F40_06785 [Candidatus Competibacteraceae bacterium]